ncbi:MAG: Flp pilus assembly protein CpaB [Lachnospiraceae bacterium]|nr:Flp pilus assembly protein CpaB [Lachnospiraceae bacterium]
MKRVYLIALVVALMAGSATFAFANSLIKNSKMDGRATQDVLVALEEIKDGTPISKEEMKEKFVVKKIVKDYVTPGAVSSLDEIEGQVVRTVILPNEQVSSTKIMPPNSDAAGLSYKLKAGEVAISISAAGVQGVDGYINNGDTIDILVADSKLEEQLLDENIDMEEFKNIEVLNVATKKEVVDAQSKGGDESTVNTYVSLTIRTNEVVANDLYKMETITGGNFKLILHAKIDSMEGQEAAE